MIAFHQRLLPAERQLLELALLDPGASDHNTFEHVAALFRHHLVCVAHERATTFCSLLHKDADSIGPAIFNPDIDSSPRFLYVDWLSTIGLGSETYVSTIDHKYRQVTSHPLQDLSIIDPLPSDYEPVLRRILTHLETPGLTRIEVIVGVLRASWIEQLDLDLEVDLILHALVVIEEGVPYDDFARLLEPKLRPDQITGVPHIVKARAGL